MTRVGSATVVLLLAVAGAEFAQGQHHMAAAGSEKPVALLPGLGAWRHPIATNNPEAQKFFDQGLILVYGFNRPEALRSFRKAAELDPRAAMPYWGVAMALGPYLNMDMDPDVHLKESCEAAQAGLRMAGVAAVEKAWLEAAAARCPDYSDPEAYVRAMRTLAEQQPDDPDAQTLYAESLLLPVRWHWYTSGKAAEGVEEAEHVLEGVLRRHPDHPGANHFYIHAVESSPTPERGIASAQRLMGIVPAAGHIVHMPGHIWLVLGDYNNTVAVNERAVEVDRQYFATTGVSSSYGMYYLHNLQFLLYARAMQGRTAETAKVAQQMDEIVKGMVQSMPEMAEMAEVFGIFINMSRLRLLRWDEVLAAGQPKTAIPTAFWHFARALSFAAKNDPQSARREQAEFDKLARTLDRNFPWDTNKLGDVLDFASAAAAAKLETSPAKALPLWKKAVELQDGLNYDEPPAWYYPLRESLGAALLRTGDAAAAEAVFREGLRRSPNNGRMLFGLLESLKAQHKSDAIAWVEREYESAWRGADLKLRIADL